MYFVHGFLGIGAIVLAYIHTLVNLSSGLIKLTGDYALWILIGTAAYSILFLSGWITDRIHWVKLIVRFLERHIFKHETSVWLHRLNLVATIFVFIHVLLIDYIMQINSFALTFYLYSFITFLSYSWFIVSRYWRFSKANVIEVKDLGGDMTQMILKFSKIKIGRLRQYQPGDYVFISFPNLEKMKEMHPFSFVDFDLKNKQIVLAIRGDGDFSRRVAQIKNGAQVLVDGPYGTLNNQIVEQENSKQPLVMLAGGTGAVPLINLALRYAQEKEIYFVWTVSHQDQLVYRELLLNLAKKQNKFHYLESIHRLNPEKLSKILETSVLENGYYLLSGSNIMMMGYKKMLRKFGITPGEIYYEKFSF
ncbi:FAD-dependent oxidoreductase [Oenococcus kitaharae]|uniref:FAD-dependent oxidoreductase n=1 Tax=Oenococcus TaxID=46254 RepID=UPI002981D89C|nr:FAD-dependent oxidoreductase [Oenococcus kitaharae]